MNKLAVLCAATLLLLGSVLFNAPARDANAKGTPKILEFDTMVGVPRPYTGSANAIRGVSGGGVPWVIDFAKGELSVNGDLEVTVRGLVIDPNIDNPNAGRNPVAEFRAIVSCLSKDESGNPTTVNLTTDPFPATTGLGAGNAKIEAHLDLPSPCIAPIVFVTNPGGAWFAATGN